MLTSRDAAPEGHQVRPEQGQVSKLIFENNAIRNRISNDFSGAFLNQKRNKQTSHESQKNLDSDCISFCTSSRKRQ